MSLFAKLWTDILGDPKLLRAARLGAKHLHLLPWLIVFAKKAEDGGRLSIGGAPAEPEDIAHGIPCVTAKQVAAAIAELASVDVLIPDDDGAMRFIAWERRSGHKPSDDAEAVRERVAKHRARKRAGKREDETPCNTLDVTRGNATEKEIEQESEKEEDKEREQGARYAPSVGPSLVTDFLSEFAFGAHAESVAGIIRAARVPSAVTGVLRMHLTAESGYEPATPAEIGRACQALAANGEDFNQALFAGYVRRSKRVADRTERRRSNEREEQHMASEERTRASNVAEEAEADALLESFAAENPDRYREIAKAENSAVPLTLTIGREAIVRGRILTAIRRERVA